MMIHHGAASAGGTSPAAAAVAAAHDEPEHFEGIPEMDDRIIGDIKEYASENPERVAEVIQSWIREIDLSGNVREAVGD